MHAGSVVIAFTIRKSDDDSEPTTSAVLACWKQPSTEAAFQPKALTDAVVRTAPAILEPLREPLREPEPEPEPEPE
eukprot:COSAG06_NODE_23409_length_692_cov_2.021922_1_plen_75_part_10